MTTSDRFEDRLLAQLRQVVAERPAPAIAAVHRAPRRTRLAMAGAGLATATAAVAVLATSGDRTPAAFAVQQRANGSVTVHINSLRDADGLQSKLRAAGVPAVVDYSPDGPACTPGAVPPPEAGDGPVLQQGLQVRREGRPGDPPPAGAGPILHREEPVPGGAGAPTHSSSQIRFDGDGATFTLDPGDLQDGQKVFITTSSGALQSISMAIAKTKPDLPCPRQLPGR